jgi:Cu-processing system permease protein
MRAFLTLTGLTLREALRRRVLLAALLCGLAFLALYAIGLGLAVANSQKESVLERRMMTTMLTLATLYATHFLLIMTGVLLSVDTLSGEIASGVIQTMAARPIPRATIVFGKWLGHWLVLVGYTALLCLGVLGITWGIARYVPPNPLAGLPLLLLSATTLLSVSIAGGARMGTITNGIVAFGLFGLAFIGGWVEQIGAFTGNDSARYVGTVVSLLMPCEAMWQLAAHHMQPTIMRELAITPFSPASVPSGAMVLWSIAYCVAGALAGAWSFAKRSL